MPTPPLEDAPLLAGEEQQSWVDLYRRCEVLHMVLCMVLQPIDAHAPCHGTNSRGSRTCSGDGASRRAATNSAGRRAASCALSPASLTTASLLRPWVRAARRAYSARCDVLFPPVFIASAAFAFWAGVLPFWLSLFLVPLLFIGGTQCFLLRGEPRLRGVLEGQKMQ